MTSDLYNADCFDILPTIPDGSVSLILTDPPYLKNYKTNYRINKEHRFCKPIYNDNNPSVIVDLIKHSYRILKNNSALYMFCSWDHVDFFKTEIEKYFKIKNIIIWVKNNWTAGDLKCQFGQRYEMIIYANKGTCKIKNKRLSDVWSYNRITNGYHQNEKPIPLLERCISKHSNEGDLVLDPMSGSCTLALACDNLNRNWICIEKDAGYCEKALKRINDNRDLLATDIFRKREYPRVEIIKP